VIFFRFFLTKFILSLTKLIYNDREREMGCKLAVSMVGNQTILAPSSTDHRNSGERRFGFDYSYWSHDGCQTESDGYLSPDPSHANGSKYADQKKVFSDVGMGILSNAWEGYNASLFAYGQTGTAKSLFFYRLFKSIF
jgi:hypothetical protein